MHIHILVVSMKSIYLFLQILFSSVVSSHVDFTYNGFLQANLSLAGDSFVRSNGILSITNESNKLLGHAFYPFPIRFKEKQLNTNKNRSSSVSAFSTTFVFSMNPRYPDLGGHGFTFILSSTKELKGCLPNQYLGLPNITNAAEFSTRFLAVEFDTVQNLEFGDINDNHVGIDISSLISNVSKPAAYYLDTSTDNNISIVLKSGDAFQAWIDYNQEMKISVTLSPLGVDKPKKPLISFPIDISTFVDEEMYVGFSASTGLLAAAHNILGWSFKFGGKADLDLSELPSLEKSIEIVHRRGFAIGITISILVLVFLVVCGVLYVLRRIKSGHHTLEDWEMEYGAHRFKYSELHTATKGFGEGNVIGVGGFGKVYKGVIASTGLEVAIKRVTHDSQQGMREFVAEIMSLGQLRHRNLVQLHGWCRRQDELLLVYDYVPNGSLDKLLFSNPQHSTWILSWQQKYKILTGVAQALLYLHEECDQRIVHRDLKPSNVLIDADLNPKLGDFGMARIYEHGIQSQTTHIVGTLGYLAPELTKTGKATTSTDVYGYGALILEVVCGRRPIEPLKNAEEVVLVDWVRELHFRGNIIQAVDPALDEFNSYEVEVVLSLGLLCTYPHPDHRPSIRRVVEVLLGDADLPNLPPDLDRQSAGVVTDYSESYPDESIPSLDCATSSKSTIFLNFDKKISPKLPTSITF